MDELNKRVNKMSTNSYARIIKRGNPYHVDGILQLKTALVHRRTTFTFLSKWKNAEITNNVCFILATIPEGTLVDAMMYPVRKLILKIYDERLDSPKKRNPPPDFVIQQDVFEKSLPLPLTPRPFFTFLLLKP